MARDVKVAILGDASSFNRAFRDASGEAGSFGAAMQATSAKVQSAGKIMMGVGAGLTAGLTLPLVLLGKSALDAASNFNESLSKSNTIFKEAAADVEAWAGTAAKSFGQSKQQALENAASFGNMFRQIGIGLPKATAMSTAMVELASDFASFHNADITEVLLAQQAAFRGEYDSVQRFVPTINAAAVETKALAMSGKDNAKELTNQEKAMAAYTLMVEGAGDALGDFDRTASGAANQQRILTARWEDAKAKLGQGLIPIYLKLAERANQILDVYNNLSPVQQDFVLKGLAIAAALGPVTTIIGGLITALGLLLSPVGLAAAAIGVGLVVAAREANISMADVKAWVEQNWPNIRDWIVNAVADVKAKFEEWWPQIKDAAVTAWKDIEPILIDLKDKILPELVKWMDLFGKASLEAFKNLKEGVVDAWNVIEPIVGPLIDVIAKLSKAVRTLADLSEKLKSLSGGFLPDFGDVINPFKIPDFSPGFDIPGVPGIASGGVVKRTGLALVHKGEEWSGVGSAYQPLGSRTGGLQVPSGDIVFQVGGEVIARIARRAALQDAQAGRSWS